MTWIEALHTEEVTGSNPVSPTKEGPRLYRQGPLSWGVVFYQFGRVIALIRATFADRRGTTPSNCESPSQRSSILLIDALAVGW